VICLQTKPIYSSFYSVLVCFSPGRLSSTWKRILSTQSPSPSYSSSGAYFLRIVTKNNCRQIRRSWDLPLPRIFRQSYRHPLPNYPCFHIQHFPLGACPHPTNNNLHLQHFFIQCGIYESHFGFSTHGLVLPHTLHLGAVDVIQTGNVPQLVLMQQPLSRP